MIDLTNKIFHDEDAAREHLEAQRWPDGPVCPHCGSRDVTKLEGSTHRKGVYQCKVKPCREQFTVTVGSVMERSHIPLTKWVLAIQLMAASKKGVSAKQIERMLAISYRSAWFLMHRIREAMNGMPSTGPIGGENKVIESDETYVGGKAKNAHKSKGVPKKHAVGTLVEREGEVRARHIPAVTAKNVRDHLVTKASRASYIMTDDGPTSHKAAEEFRGHDTVNHSADQYVKLGGFVHVNTAESYHALVKRSIFGAWHAVSEQHLQRYIDEISFRWNTRIALGFDDAKRAAAIIKATEGKRLTYRRSYEA